MTTAREGVEAAASAASSAIAQRIEQLVETVDPTARGDAAKRTVAAISDLIDGIAVLHHITTGQWITADLEAWGGETKTIPHRVFNPGDPTGTFCSICRKYHSPEVGRRHGRGWDGPRDSGGLYTDDDGEEG